MVRRPDRHNVRESLATSTRCVCYRDYSNTGFCRQTGQSYRTAGLKPSAALRNSHRTSSSVGSLQQCARIHNSRAHADNGYHSCDDRVHGTWVVALHMGANQLWSAKLSASFAYPVVSMTAVATGIQLALTAFLVSILEIRIQNREGR